MSCCVRRQLPKIRTSARRRVGYRVCRAGTSPTISVAIKQMPALSDITRQSISPGRYIATPERAGKSSTSACRHQNATRSPPAAPSVERIRPSVRSCFNKRTRLAPMASRIVISWRRANDLTSSRLPTFAQAMRRTNAPTASMISSVGSRVPALLKGVCHNGHSLMPRPRFVAE